MRSRSHLQKLTTPFQIAAQQRKMKERLIFAEAGAWHSHSTKCSSGLCAENTKFSQRLNTSLSLQYVSYLDELQSRTKLLAHFPPNKVRKRVFLITAHLRFPPRSTQNTTCFLANVNIMKNKKNFGSGSTTLQIWNKPGTYARQLKNQTTDLVQQHNKISWYHLRHM